jgi:hypothetical protein
MDTFLASEARTVLADLVAEIGADKTNEALLAEYATTGRLREEVHSLKARLDAVVELCEKWVERGGYDSKHALRDVLALARGEGASTRVSEDTLRLRIEGMEEDAANARNNRKPIWEDVAKIRDFIEGFRGQRKTPDFSEIDDMIDLMANIYYGYQELPQDEE